MSKLNASQTLQTATTTLTPAPSGILQRKCASCGNHTIAGGKCDDCENKKGVLQRKSSNNSEQSEVPPIVHEVLNSSGQPLNETTRAFFEPRFGHDFSRVRVHTDSKAAESARAVNALAYTVGQDIVFAPQQYQPRRSENLHLLAHELAHTVQQQGLQRFSDDLGFGRSSEYVRLEREAETAAGTVMRGETASVARPASGLRIQRVPWNTLLEGGKCPEGTPLDARNKDVNESAELRAAGIYRQGKSENIIVFSNLETKDDHQGKLEELKVKDEMLQALQGEFHRGPGIIPHPSQEVELAVPPRPLAEPEEAVDAPPPTKKPKVPLKPKDPKQEEEKKRRVLDPRQVAKLMYRRPDILDVTARRVFDITTGKEAPRKTSKITSYVNDLNGIRNLMNNPGDPWQAGTDADFPTITAEQLIFRFRGVKSPDIICFGPTDLATNQGVIAYDAIKLGGETIQALGEPYEVSINGEMVTIYSYPAPSFTDLLNSGPNNKAVAESIPGVILKKLNRKNKGTDTIDAEIETAGNTKSEHKSTVPIETEGDHVPVIYTVNKKTRQLTLQGKKVNIPIKYHKLSTGAITKLNHSEETGLSGEGYIKPSIPLLKGLDIHFAFAQDSLVVRLPKKKPHIPIPGFTVKEFDLALELLPEFKPSGTIGFTIGTGKRALMSGVLEISADAEGLLATGDVFAHIPGLDEAKGHVTYSKSKGWSGSFIVTASNIKFVQNASVTVTLNNDGLNLHGGMDVVLPGEQRASLRIKKMSDTSWVYTGKGEFKVPKLKPVVISFVYDGRNVTGTAKTGFTFKGLEGDIHLAYENGDITGTAHLEILKSKGRLKGYLDVTLNKNRNFSGEGKVIYEIKPGLIASAGIILKEDEQVTVVGSLKFPDYKLFDQFPKPATPFRIFGFGPKDIPVPFLSIGPLGLQARIGAGLFVSYGIGPGMIVDGFVKAEVNPLEEDPDPKFELGGKLKIPAFFRVTGYISGGLVLDLLIAEAGGKIIVSATAGLEGEAGAKFLARYADGELKLETDLYAVLELVLRFCVDAYVWASAGVWRFKVTTGKSWNLLGYEYRPGLKLGIEGLKKPITYSSKTGLSLPSFEDINWVKPSLDAGNALKSGVEAAGNPPEVEGKPKPNPCPGPIMTDED